MAKKERRCAGREANPRPAWVHPTAEARHRATLAYFSRRVPDPDHPGASIDLHSLQLRRMAEAYRRQQPRPLSSAWREPDAYPATSPPR